MTDPNVPDPSAEDPEGPLFHPSEDGEWAMAARRVDDDLAVLRTSQLEPINRDVLVVITSMMANCRRLEPHLPELATLTGFDITRVRALGDYVGALMHWQVKSTHPKDRPPEMAPLVEHAIELRRQVLGDLRALANHGVVPGEVVDRFGSSVAHGEIALELTALSSFTYERWADLEGKSAMTRETIHELAKAGFAIVQACGDRMVASRHVSRAVARRNRAYTRVVQVYAEARSGITYLRRNRGDADLIAPALHARVKKRKRKKAEAEDREPSAATEAGRSVSAMSALGPTMSSTIVPEDADAASRSRGRPAN